MVARMVHGCKDPASESGLPRLAYFIINSGDFGLWKAVEPRHGSFWTDSTKQKSSGSKNGNSPLPGENLPPRVLTARWTEGPTE